MRTLIVTHYFPPEIGALQARFSQFPRSWAEAGDEVTVLTACPTTPLASCLSSTATACAVRSGHRPPPELNRRILQTGRGDGFSEQGPVILQSHGHVGPQVHGGTECFERKQVETLLQRQLSHHGDDLSKAQQSDVVRESNDALNRLGTKRLGQGRQLS